MLKASPFLCLVRRCLRLTLVSALPQPGNVQLSLHQFNCLENIVYKQRAISQVFTSWT